MMTTAEACALIEPALTGGFRREVVDAASSAPDLRTELERLRDSMRGHLWHAGGRTVSLGRIVKPLDARTREEGFHVLNDWDGKSDRVNEDIIPVDVLDYIVRLRGGRPADPMVAAILVDYYFVHVLSLLAVRAWDDGDPDDNLDRIDELLGRLQGAEGSGQPFAASAATLILLATSHYERHERGYAVLLDNTRRLSPRRQAAIAMQHAASMGSHLRFGFEATYARDTVIMRDDNVADYPWLCFAVATVMKEYVSLHEAGPSAELDAAAEALLNGLSGDARALVGQAPPCLSAQRGELEAFKASFAAHRDELLDTFARFRPAPDGYSPLAFFFNFSHNVLKGTVVDALLRGRPWPLMFDDLLTGLPREGERSAAKRSLAETLMGYARANPDRIRGELKPVIVYDPLTGRQAFSVAMSKLRA